jgi:hypothetical protein
MKKIIIFLSIILFFLFIPKVYASTNVSIESVTLDSKSADTEIINEATFEGLSINFDIKFKNVDDFAKYEIVINNQADEDYEITNNIEDSEYISYEISDVDSNILTKNSKTTIYITIKYTTKIPNEEYENGSFVEKNNITINLANEEQEPVETPNEEVEEEKSILENPKTQNGLHIIIIILLINLGLLIIFRKHKPQRYIGILLICCSLIPLSIGALKQLQITVNSNITVDKKPLARDVLLIDTNSEQKTPYVLCPVKNGEEIPCRVLYDKTSEYGLQLISVSPVATVRLGSNDLKVTGSGVTRAQNSYMRAITTLNEAALEFKDDNGISKDVRCVGSKPTDKYYPDYLTGTARTDLYWNTGSYHYEWWISPYLNKFFERDNNYVNDDAQLKLLGIDSYEDTSVSSEYWMASRVRGSVIAATTASYGQTWYTIRFGVRYADNTGYYGYPYQYLFEREGKEQNSYSELYYDKVKGLRQVWVINDNVLVTKGDGTIDNPYVLEPAE